MVGVNTCDDHCCRLPTAVAAMTTPTSISAHPTLLFLFVFGSFVALCGLSLFDASSNNLQLKELPKHAVTLAKEARRDAMATPAPNPTPLLALTYNSSQELRLGRQLTVPTSIITYTHRVEVYNPALTVYNGKVFMVARHEGRNMTAMWQTCPDTSLSTSRPCPVPDLRMISFVVLCELGPDLLPRTALQHLPYTVPWDKVMETSWARELGPEDPRLFELDGGTFMVYNALPGPPVAATSPRCVRSMKIQRLFPTLLPSVELVILDRGPMERYEKNWSPLGPDPTEPSTKVLLSRYAEPHQVLSCSVTEGKCRVVAETSQTKAFDIVKTLWKIKSIHLGTNVVWLPDGRGLGLLHGLPLGQKRYLNFAYTVAPTSPWKIQAIATDPLDLPLGTVGHGFAFTSSLAWIDGKLVVGYNVNDRSASFAVVDWKALVASLRTVA
eukprot:m.70332 g.70332  ORF g.70332 m.70332 type:complete len:440 (+) comp14060_c0_seq3:86-1405(+)